MSDDADKRTPAIVLLNGALMHEEAVIDIATTAVGDAATPSTETGVTPSVDIDVIIETRAAYKAALEAAADNFRIAQRYGAARVEVITTQSRRQTHSFPDSRAIDALMREYDGTAWYDLLHKSGLRSFLDATAREAWSKHLRDGTAPELTKENVAATFALLFEQRGHMFERGVIELFRKLRWSYKTNSPRLLGKRIILTNGTLYSSTFTDRLDDIVRVFTVLDGKPEPDHRQGAYGQLRSKDWPKGQNNIVIDGYFSCRGFKNGNCHLTFLRLDLVEQANKMIAKAFPNALPPSDDD
jgi:hypothetical protein